MPLHSNRIFLNDVLHPIMAVMRRHISVYAHYWDKTGRPLLYVHVKQLSVGKVLEDLSELCSAGSEPMDLLMLYYSYVMEVVQLLILYNSRRFAADGPMPIFTETKDKNQRWSVSGVVSSCDVIFVCDNHRPPGEINLRSLRNVVKRMVKHNKRYYPVVLQNVYVVNATLFARSLARSLRNELGVETSEKIKFIPGGELSELARSIAVHHIPPFCMGECSCDMCTHRSDDPSVLSVAAGSGSTSDATMAPMLEKDPHHPVQMVRVAPGKTTRLFFALVADEEVLWEFRVRDGKDILFAVVFTNASTGDVATVVSLQRMSDGSGHYISPTSGTLIVHIQNPIKLFVSRQLDLRIGKY